MGVFEIIDIDITFCLKSIRNGGEQICDGSRFGETGSDRKEIPWSL